MSNRPRFTPKQVDYICYQIGDWYLNWKGNITTGQHRLGIAKEELKSMICGNEYPEHVEESNMKDTILKYLDEQIEDAKILKAQASGHNRENILGCLNALEDVKEFIELLTEEIEDVKSFKCSVCGSAKESQDSFCTCAHI